MLRRAGPRLAAAALAGALLAAAQPHIGLWPALFLAGPALYLLWEGRTPRAAFGVGWAAGAGFFAAALHWIVDPFFVDAARHGWMAPFAILLLAGGLALFWGAGFALAAAMGRVVGGPLALALAWTAAETARGSVLTGFPWSLPAYAWMETPVAQGAALIGPYGLSLLTLAAVLAPGALLRRPRAFVPALVALPALAALWLWGAARLEEASAPGPERPLIRVVQTDVDQRDKWEPENVVPQFEALLALSTEGEAAPALVLWPEAAVSFPIDMAEEARARIRGALGPAALGLGSLRLDAGPEARIEIGARWRNSFFVLSGEGLSQPYDKIHLVPFGEYLPFDDFMSRIGVAAMAGLGGGIAPGRERRLMTAPGLPPFAALICYEMIFPGETRAAAEGAEWLALVTNDGWFGSWAGPAQHLAAARLRAIETGLPVARAANRGYSAMIDPWGRTTPLRHGAAAVDARLPDSAAPTPYRRFGSGPALFLGVVLVAVATLSRRRRDISVN